MGDDEKEDKPKLTKAAAVRKIGKRWLRAGLIAGPILGAAFGITNAFTDWVYQVKTNYGVIITQPLGDRVAI